MLMAKITLLLMLFKIYVRKIVLFHRKNKLSIFTGNGEARKICR